MQQYCTQNLANQEPYTSIIYQPEQFPPLVHNLCWPRFNREIIAAVDFTTTMQYHFQTKITKILCHSNLSASQNRYTKSNKTVHIADPRVLFPPDHGVYLSLCSLPLRAHPVFSLAQDTYHAPQYCVFSLNISIAALAKYTKCIQSKLLGKTFRIAQPKTSSLHLLASKHSGHTIVYYTFQNASIHPPH